MNDALIFAYRFHKREFGIRDNRYLRCFDAIVEETPCNILECSPSISSGAVHASRLRAGYVQEWVQEGLDVMWEFVHAIGRHKPVELDPSGLKILLEEDLDRTTIDALGVGIDLRPRLWKSKIKCYFLLLDYVKNLHRLIPFHPPVDEIDRYFVHNDVVLGIDMYFDGNTGIELYPYFTQEDLRDENLLKYLRFGGPALTLLSRCRTVNLSFDTGGRRILHFFPTDPTWFIQAIGNRDVSRLYSSVRILNMLLARADCIQRALASVALYEDEIMSDAIQNVNLYYTVSEKRNAGGRISPQVPETSEGRVC
jgi:LynF/TruF/PatF family peptide O-prenyltransferase